MKIMDAVLLISIVWLTFELGNLLLETLWQKSLSPLFVLITNARIKGTLWLSGELQVRSKQANSSHEIETVSFARLWSIDAYGNLLHAIVIMSLCVIVNIFAVILVTDYILWWGVAVILCTMVAIILDLLVWLPISTTLFFKSFDMILEYKKLESSVIQTSILDSEIKRLRDLVLGIRMNDFFPYFIARFSIIILLLILVFSAEYTFVSIIDNSSFVDSGGKRIQSFWDFLYSSAMLTATFGPIYEPATPLSKFLIGIHALLTLCLLVIIITFFSSLSEEKLETEKNIFLHKLDSV